VGIIPVHLYGQAADMDAVMALAARHRLWVLEDCAQAHLATFRGRKVGTFGAAATYSFYPSKNLGAMGDAGAVVTNDGALAERIAVVARHGGLHKGDHRVEGVNSRMDGLQAAVLLAKLEHLAHWTTRRRELAAEYSRRLAGIAGLGLPTTAAGREHVWHLYVVQHAARDRLARHLGERGVQTVINYPVALPFLPAYARFAHRPEDFPNAHRSQSRILSIPLYPEMTPAQMQAVTDAVASFRA
jgi:dTDP-4-amino-4,6-dideoxygalactose transaminase